MHLAAVTSLYCQPPLTPSVKRYSRYGARLLPPIILAPVAPDYDEVARERAVGELQLVSHFRNGAVVGDRVDVRFRQNLHSRGRLADRNKARTAHGAFALIV